MMTITVTVIMTSESSELFDVKNSTESVWSWQPMLPGRNRFHLYLNSTGSSIITQIYLLGRLIIDYWGYWAFPRNCKPINPLILQVRLKQSRYPDRLNTKVEYHQQCTYVWLIQGSTTTTTMYPDSVVLYICRGHYTQTTTKAYFSIILRSFLRCKQFRSFQLGLVL